MERAGMYDNLADVLDVVEISSDDVANMTAAEMKARIKEQIDAQVDKFYRQVQQESKTHEKLLS